MKRVIFAILTLLALTGTVIGFEHLLGYYPDFWSAVYGVVAIVVFSFVQVVFGYGGGHDE